MSEMGIGSDQGGRRAWALLVLAGCFEPLWVISMKLSAGFTDMPWVMATAVFMVMSMYFLAMALRGGMAMGTAYAVWVGIGAIGALIAGILIFDESSEPLRIAFVLLIIAGIAGLQMSSKGP